VVRRTAMEPRLPFPTKPLFINGIEVEEYMIPEHRKAEVLQALFVVRVAVEGVCDSDTGAPAVRRQ